MFGQLLSIPNKLSCFFPPFSIGQVYMYIKKELLPNFYYYKYRFKSRARQMLFGARKAHGGGLMNSLKMDLMSQVCTCIKNCSDGYKLSQTEGNHGYLIVYSVCISDHRFLSICQEYFLKLVLLAIVSS